jgi:hypothetical protein
VTEVGVAGLDDPPHRALDVGWGAKLADSPGQRQVVAVERARREVVEQPVIECPEARPARLASVQIHDLNLSLIFFAASLAAAVAFSSVIGLLDPSTVLCG